MNAELPNLLDLIHRATSGDQGALETLVSSVEDDLYGLAMRMLGHPADAEDATQEILLIIVTHLAEFEGRSSFRTWTWRIAAHHLLRVKKGRRETVDFDQISKFLEAGENAPPEDPPVAPTGERAVLIREVKVACTSGMLLALDRDHRMAFVLCEILELSGDEAAAVLEIEPATLRKRVSRAKARLHEYMRSKCGLVNEDNPCRCARQVPVAQKKGNLEPGQLLFATHPVRHPEAPAVASQMQEVDQLQRMVTVFRSHPDYAAPGILQDKLRGLMASGRLRLFDA
jgi:RNA polymerase sigma factor (sigma-70 family)